MVTRADPELIRSMRQLEHLPVMIDRLFVQRGNVLKPISIVDEALLLMVGVRIQPRGERGL